MNDRCHEQPCRTIDGIVLLAIRLVDCVKKKKKKKKEDNLVVCIPRYIHRDVSVVLSRVQFCFLAGLIERSERIVSCNLHTERNIDYSESCTFQTFYVAPSLQNLDQQIKMYIRVDRSNVREKNLRLKGLPVKTCFDYVY